jgi:tRNA nucleotidyltransferase (CCA-adding enzyme)
MQVYLVGGAVRDELLGRPVRERDWVVVGATPDQMIECGYRAVGRDFPVFLHPETREEYALARLERKTGPGYRGFVTEHSPDVTLEQDLQRRDLTVNAMARDADGTLIDPFGGQQDLQRRRLHHVSPAFVEDPVRILRVARFAARFAPLGFVIAEDTRVLLRSMVAAGEVAALVPERVWRELERALEEAAPEQFFSTLADCGALPIVLPGLRWDDASRTALQATVSLTRDGSVRFAAVAGSGAGADVDLLCTHLRPPVRYSELALLSARTFESMRQADCLDPGALLALLESSDAVRRPERFERLLLVCAARGCPPAALQRVRMAAERIAQTTLPPELLRSLPGPAIAAALREKRLAQLAALPAIQSDRRRS